MLKSINDSNSYLGSVSLRNGHKNSEKKRNERHRISNRTGVMATGEEGTRDKNQLLWSNIQERSFQLVAEVLCSILNWFSTHITKMKL
ncbi:hypothetical protein MGG_18070 [Pyricularia oryzae 70-15]|uniref:Uncharacterized protein n=1 Tax=Pyricularia oryzae (strain 70-15 / ATCC MYA-4617 / FGSC 8958) TaxID=242507 RepID=G5EHI3_PYRO7|nr:uncharacterized protein MGG_18070 [Pyricularia oryzae 70-15]EAQ70681.1 hypothetical protein MGCH7_ch7g88 [Pyricularia oryzae 70-15]EHA46675.1 hypothetical protein MGG_18070 [Pyricularia oryzae 70-15]